MVFITFLNDIPAPQPSQCSRGGSGPRSKSEIRDTPESARISRPKHRGKIRKTAPLAPPFRRPCPPVVRAKAPRLAVSSTPSCPTPMPVRQLPEQVVNRIAAGEVVERPASVVKELVENAIDAGASRIDIFTDGGGRRRIGITDDGGGMTAADLALAVDRHATSKLDDEDLLQIRTLGFRGEALPSIGAVARLGITTRHATEPHAWSLSVEGRRQIADHAGGARPRHARRGQRSVLRHAGAAEIPQDRPHRGRSDPRSGAAAGDGAARHRVHAGRRGTRAGDLGRRACPARPAG